MITRAPLRSTAARILLLPLALATGSCSSSSFLSGAASMRIDVDVYKGPLSNTETVQKGQLDALLKSSIPALNDIDGQLVASMCRLGCVQRDEPTEDDEKKDGKKVDKKFDPDDYTLNYGHWDGDEYSDATLAPRNNLQKNYDYVVKVLQPLTPTVTECQELGVPQRRTLNYDAWFGKTYKPADFDGSDSTRHETPSAPGERYFEDSSKLYDTLPLTKKKCMDDKTDDPKVCKGGILGIWRRYVKPVQKKKGANSIIDEPNDLEAARVQNRKRDISRWKRYPAWQEEFHVCPLYPRMRAQIAVIKGELIEHENHAFLFSRIVDQTDALAKVQKEYGKELDDQLKKVCEALTDPKKKSVCDANAGAYKKALGDYFSKLTDFKNSIAPYADAQGKYSLVPEQAVAMLAYIQAAQDILGSTNKTKSAIEDSVKAIGALEDSLGIKREITKLANTLNDAKSDFGSASQKPSLVDFGAAFDKVKDDAIEPKQPLSGANAEAWSDALEILQREREKISSDPEKAQEALKAAEKALEDARDGNLGAYLSRKSVDESKIETAVGQFENLNSRLDKLKTEIAAALTVSQSALAQHKAKTSFDGAKTIDAPNKTVPPDQQSDALKTAGDQLKKVGEMVRQTAADIEAWKDSRELKDFAKAVDDATAALTAAEKAKKWVEGSEDHYKELKSALDAIAGAAFPSPIPTDDQASEFHKHLASIRELIAGAADKHPLATLFDQAVVYKDVPAATNALAAAQSAIADDGLSDDEGSLDKKLTSAKTTLGNQAASLTALENGIQESLKQARLVQNQSDKISYATIAGLAGGFRVLATAISYQVASVEPPDKRLRIDLLKAANMAAEFANQLTSRANALERQQDMDARLLSTGQYLRDSKPTAFLDAYDWLDAGTHGEVVPRRTRIDTAKRLFDDDNWANVNEVYASGVGKTAMAFIRDEIGNWNLKSFDNDPTELTAAYAKLGVKLVKKAASLAATGGAVDPDKISSMTSLMQSAQSAATGDVDTKARAGALVNGLDLESFRRELADKLARDEEKLKQLEDLAEKDKTNKDVQAEEEKTLDDAKAQAARYKDLIDALEQVAAVKAKQTQGEQPK